MTRKYRLSTLGCKVNQYESQQIRELLESLGIKPALNEEPADLAIVNTCAVTSTALAKSRQAIRRATHQHKTPVIVVGCGAGAQASAIQAIPGVIAVLSHNDNIIDQLRDFLVLWVDRSSATRVEHSQNTTALEPERPQAVGNEVWMIAAANAPTEQTAAQHTVDSPLRIIPTSPSSVKDEASLTSTISTFDEHQRAFLKVQDGCDANCTYCIIPALRSNLKSKPVDVAVAEATKLVQAGHKEIVVTGIFLGAYKCETASRNRLKVPRPHLAELVSELANIPGLKRLRMSSLEPGDVSEQLLEVIATRDNCVPHLHLPLQSGSDNILKRMNRQYRCDDYLKTVERIRTALDSPSITTDIIVGFPGEESGDFTGTMDVAREVGFSRMHVFPFSPREGTPAASWQRDFVCKETARKRASELRSLGEQLSHSYVESMVGRAERVMIEEQHGSGSQWIGHADRYFQVVVDLPQAKPGQIVKIRVDRTEKALAYGTIID